MRWDSERELSLRRHCTRTRKYNRLLHKFGHRSFHATQVYQIHWNNAMQRPLSRSRSFKVTDLGTNRKLIYDFILVINTNLYHILHRFRDIAFERSKIAIFGYPSWTDRQTTDGRTTTYSEREREFTFTKNAYGTDGSIKFGKVRCRNSTVDVASLDATARRPAETRHDCRTSDEFIGEDIVAAEFLCSSMVPFLTKWTDVLSALDIATDAITLSLKC